MGEDVCAKGEVVALGRKLVEGRRMYAAGCFTRVFIR
jgi:hypothetical protein